MWTLTINGKTIVTMENKLSPVAIFVYNRVSNTTQTIEALRKNYLAQDTDVFVFSDAAKNENNKKKVAAVRAYLKTVSGFKSFTVIERQENFYIEKNIISGVTEIINKYGKIIVLEDDGVSNKNFLSFMNKSLNFYEKYNRIMHIATFTFVKMPDNFNKTFFWRYSENTGGGWGTWKNRWDKFKWFQNEEDGLRLLTEEQKNIIELDGAHRCLSSLKAKPIPWDICWYIAIIKNNGLSVNSPRALIKNNGLYNGTHFNILNKLLGKSPFEIELEECDNIDNIVFDSEIRENRLAESLLKEFYTNLSNRKNNKVIEFILKVLVTLKITKLAKRMFK